MAQAPVSVELADLPAQTAELIGNLLQRRGINISASGRAPAPGTALVFAGFAGDAGEFRHALRTHPGVPIVAVAAYPSEALAVAAFRLGASDYLSGPVSESSVSAILDALLPAVASRRAAPMTDMIGGSAEMGEIREYIGKVAQSDSNVLITGETGTGKELVAEMIHHRSRRAAHPLACINCAAIPEGLLESELFGHERGAFTGAHTATAGQMEAANGGTVFFDEIGEMSLYAQAKILRALETKEVHRVGGRTRIALDVRIIAATNRDLDSMARDDTFRKDLYFRLNIGRIHLPPLRERKSDILELTEHYLRELNVKFRAQVTGLDADLEGHFLNYGWPGNVRELKNVLEGIFVSQPPPRLTMNDLPPWFRRQQRLGQKPPDREIAAGPDPELAQLIHALDQSHWNKSKAAGRLNWSRMTLYRKMAKYHVTAPKPSAQSA